MASSIYIRIPEILEIICAVFVASFFGFSFVYFVSLFVAVLFSRFRGVENFARHNIVLYFTVLSHVLLRTYEATLFCFLFFFFGTCFCWYDMVGFSGRGQENVRGPCMHASL